MWSEGAARSLHRSLQTLKGHELIEAAKAKQAASELYETMFPED